MESQWINEQEVSYAWLVNPSASEQEDVLDWIKSIGVGAAQGAGTGAAAGPWGALIGGLIGGGLGALQQATQPQPAPQRPSSPVAAPRPAPQPTTPPPPPVAPSSSPPPASPASGNKDGVGAVQQFTQLLPQLVQLIQAIQPIVASTQQSKGRAGESVDDDLESSADDALLDSAFSDEQVTEPLLAEDDNDEDIELPQPPEPVQRYSTGALLPPTNLEASTLPARQTEALTLAFPSEWSTEAEAAAVVRPGFQWVG